MLDFLLVSARSVKKGEVEIYPKFIIKPSSGDLMIRGGDFYAVWDEERKLWSTSEGTAIALIDQELDLYADKRKDDFSDQHVKILHLWDSDSGMIDKWHKYVQKQMRDNFHPLDERLIFSNTETRKEDYASRRLPYPLKEGPIDAYEKLIGTLYSPEERHKIEWAIGAVVSGEAKHIQKFLVLYGSAGTGKSTVLNILQQLFEGYYSVFDAKALGSASNVFALEAFKSNPLVAIQHDGDLSRIEDNTRLNSVVSHELMSVNEKFKSTYAGRFNCFLFMGTNKPVRITDAKSGLIRRLIDVTPSGNRLPAGEYKDTVGRIAFELPGIAWHCRDVYMADPGAYDSYIPVSMMGASNDFYNFILDSYDCFQSQDGTTLKAAWEMYKTYCEEAKVAYPYSQRIFREELKNYFRSFEERALVDDIRVRSYYRGFLSDKFSFQTISPSEKKENPLTLDKTESILDKECADWVAQYASENGGPLSAWDRVHSHLRDLDTSRLHYILVPDNQKAHIVVDFDLKDENGEKSRERNLEEASKWPPTYAEFSKSGAGVHLHYIYTGDPDQLSAVYAPNIEIKVFKGKSAIRRKLTLCNGLPVAEISSGLPLKGERKMVNFDAIKSERSLRTMIVKNLHKEYIPATKPSISLIRKDLDKAYDSGMHYDVSDMKQAILTFAAKSTHNAPFCIGEVEKMHFKSDEPGQGGSYSEDTIVFFDVEVFPNLFLVNWKQAGEGHRVVRMINPSSEEIEALIQKKLIGFNCRRYDNHILYARLIGYSNQRLYELSQRIISGHGDALFGEAYNLSYTDVYDFSSKKQSLKKFEIELGIHHQELGLKWDQPVPEELWERVAEYCDNDVLATEKVFEARKADWAARQILSALSGLTVNDTTNQHTARIIFGDDRNPQKQFNYRDLSKPVPYTEYGNVRRRFGEDYIFRIFDDKGQPVYRTYQEGEILPDGYSILPFFPGYTFSFGKSVYRGEEVGEGGYVYAEPGIYYHVGLDDIASMHPHSLKAEKHFGRYNENFEGLIDGRIAIKHGDRESLNTLLGGRLLPFYDTAQQADADYTADDLSYALKIAINSVYGLTSAKFPNPFKDPRNEDNIVAKRGALFMINLKHEVQKMGYTVAHIKTDSIKVPNVTEEILHFIERYGKEYGYTFEHEATYDRICLVNDAVYIAKYDKDGIQNKGGKHAGEWTATGTQFQVPYVFKTLFSKEEVGFGDMCETKSASTALYLDLNETLPDVSAEEKLLKNKIKAGAPEEELNELRKTIADGHNYIFVGKVGSFCPIKPGCGGGLLLREGAGGYGAAGGTKGYRWLEAEKVKASGKEADIDIRYYAGLVDTAVETIGRYGDFNDFVNGGYSQIHQERRTAI